MIGHLDSVSTPGKSVFVDSEELGRLLTGRRVRGVRGVGLGEMLIVKVKGESGGSGFMEGRDAHRQGLGGEVLVRVGSE